MKSIGKPVQRGTKEQIGPLPANFQYVCIDTMDYSDTPCAPSSRRGSTLIPDYFMVCDVPPMKFPNACHPSWQKLLTQKELQPSSSSSSPPSAASSSSSSLSAMDIDDMGLDEVSVCDHLGDDGGVELVPRSKLFEPLATSKFIATAEHNCFLSTGPLLCVAFRSPVTDISVLDDETKIKEDVISCDAVLWVNQHILQQLPIVNEIMYISGSRTWIAPAERWNRMDALGMIDAQGIIRSDPVPIHGIMSSSDPLIDLQLTGYYRSMQWIFLYLNCWPEIVGFDLSDTKVVLTPEAVQTACSISPAVLMQIVEDATYHQLTGVAAWFSVIFAMTCQSDPLKTESAIVSVHKRWSQSRKVARERAVEWLKSVSM